MKCLWMTSRVTYQPNLYLSVSSNNEWNEYKMHEMMFHLMLYKSAVWIPGTQQNWHTTAAIICPPGVPEHHLQAHFGANQESKSNRWTRSLHRSGLSRLRRRLRLRSSNCDPSFWLGSAPSLLSAPRVSLPLSVGGTVLVIAVKRKRMGKFFFFMEPQDQLSWLDSDEPTTLH